jgi:alpha-tubulin suppressor-like RCC1 family protein
MAVKINGCTIIDDDEVLKIPSGTIFERPVSPETGMLFVNSTTGSVEGFNGIGWQAFTQSTTCALGFGWGFAGTGALGNGIVQIMAPGCPCISSFCAPTIMSTNITDWRKIEPAKDDYIFTYGLTHRGRLYGWGTLQWKNNLNASTPNQEICKFNDWIDFSPGARFIIGLRTNGTLWSWGDGFCGRLGHSAGQFVSSPTLVSGGITDWRAVSIGSNHSLAIRSNGTIWSWGLNSSGQLGDGTTTSRSSPVSVVGGFTDWCQIAAGCNHGLAIRSNGTLWGWGNNGYGQLGDCTTTSRSSPVSVVGGISNWRQVSTGCDHTLAVTSESVAWAWGRNNFGQLGNGDYSGCSRSCPVRLADYNSTWSQLSAGKEHSLGVKLNGRAYGWGRNCFNNVCSGILGRCNNTSCQRRPFQICCDFTNWCQVSAGQVTSHAIRSIST